MNSTRFPFMDEIYRLPPTIGLRTDGGQDVREHLVLVGNVTSQAIQLGELHTYGIVTLYAHYNGTQWERCLFSEECAEMLLKLAGEGSFPYHFECIPSKAYLLYLQAKQEGRPNPRQPLKDWLLPASLESLAAAVAADLLKYPWLRQFPATPVGGAA